MKLTTKETPTYCASCGTAGKFKANETVCICGNCNRRIYKACPFCNSKNISDTDGEYFCDDCSFTF